MPNTLRPAAPQDDDASHRSGDLLAQLREQFPEGEISEEAYKYWFEDTATESSGSEDISFQAPPPPEPIWLRPQPPKPKSKNKRDRRKAQKQQREATIQPPPPSLPHRTLGKTTGGHTSQLLCATDLGSLTVASVASWRTAGRLACIAGAHGGIYVDNDTQFRITEWDERTFAADGGHHQSGSSVGPGRR